MCRGEEVEVVVAMAMAEGRERPLAVGEEGEEESVRVVRGKERRRGEIKGGQWRNAKILYFDPF